MLLLVALAALQADEAAQKLERQLAPAVVRVRNEEGAGTGFLIDSAGLLLTNAHVGCSPLPYSVEVEFPSGWKRFRRVTLAGVHRARDLALLRIDPAEHGLPLPALRLRADDPATGERVLALGFPGDYESGTRRLTTLGTIRSLELRRFGQPHLETDATAWYGNSGGPLCDARGEVVGVVTLKEPSDHRALAVPLRGVERADFVPLRERPRDDAGAREMLAAAEEALRRSRGPEGAAYADLALLLLRMAATMDAGDAELHARIGSLERERKRPKAAAAYLFRSLQIAPWPGGGAGTYRELAETLLAIERPSEARTAAMEAVLKYPDSAPASLKLAARAESRLGRWPEARRSATLGGETEVLREASARLGPERRGEAAPAAEEWLDGVVRAADAARRERRPALDLDFERLLRSFDGVQGVAPAPDGPAAPRPAPAAPAPDASRYSDDEVTALFLKAQLRAAKSLSTSGRPDAAAEILRSVIRDHPARPEAAEARALLEAR